MAAKKIDIKFDLDSKSVKIAGEDTMKLTQQVRLLKNELASGKYSQQEFEILSTKLGDVQDQMAKTKTRSGDLLTSLQLIPGPIGEIASKFNGAISVLKQFSGFSLKDLTFQFKETLNDVKEIGTQLFKTMGITKIYETINNALARSFVAVGVGEQAAAAGARAFSAALVTTGIGALVVALGFAVNALIDYLSATDDSTAANEALNATIKEQNRLFEVNLKAIDSATKLNTARAKAAGATEGELFKITQEGGKERLEELKKQDQQLFERAQQIIKDQKIDGETRKKLLEENGAQQLAINQQIIDQSLANEIAGLEFSAQQRDKANQKAVQQKAKNDADAAKNDADAARKKQDADAIILEAELSLLSDKDREQLEREMRFENDKKKLKAAGITDLTLLEKEYAKDQIAISNKYNKETLDKEKELQQKKRELLFIGLQDQIDVIDKANELLETDFQEDNIRLEEKRTLLQQQRDLELQSVENDEIKRLEIIKKYADAESQIDKQVTENKKAELLARQTAQLEFASAVGSALGALSGLLKEGSSAAKTAALAEIAIGTGVGFINALRIAQQSAIAGGPGAAFAFPIFYASQVAAILSAASRAKAILKSGSGGGGGGSDTPAPAPTSNSAPAPIQVSARRNQGGFVFGDGGSITDSIPTMLSNGEFVMNSKSASMFSPMLTAMNNMGNLPNTAIPQALGNQSLVDVMGGNTNNRPIKTYVTAQDMSNQQQFDRTIKSRSLI